MSSIPMTSDTVDAAALAAGTQSGEPALRGKVIWRDSPAALAWLCIAAAATAAVFYPGIAELWRSWMQRPEYSFGIFIPFICAFLLWQRKDRLAEVEAAGSYGGLLLIAAGLLLRFAGDLAVASMFVEYGMLLSIFGIALCYFGPRGLRHIWVPLAFLVFMFPLPEFLLQSLSQRLQLVSSQIGVSLIRLCDISVYLEGNIIDLGSMKLQVAEACSGLRYLFSLLTLGFIAAYFFKGRWWKKAVIFLSAVPITVFMNSLRIALVGVTVEHFGRAAAEGLLHEFEGLVIFLGCTIILVAEMWVLAHVGRDRLSLQRAFGLDFPPPAPADAQVRYRAAPLSLCAAAALLVAGAATATFAPRHASNAPERLTFNAFPMAIADYKGSPETLDQIYLDELKADDYLMADYVGPNGFPVNLYIQYYAHQDRDAATHSPRLCIPAGGWEIANLQEKSLPGVAFRGQPLKVNRVIITKDDVTLLVYYWFQQRGRNTTNEYGTKLLILWDALTRSRSDGSMVRIITPIRPGEPMAAGDTRLTRFAGRLLPQLTPYIPN